VLVVKRKNVKVSKFVKQKMKEGSARLFGRDLKTRRAFNRK
jgi:hypothetical protein